MAKHINILGSLFLTLNILMLMLGFVTNYILGTMPGLGEISHDSIAIRITSIIGKNWGLFSFILSLPGLICGYGLLIKKSLSKCDQPSVIEFPIKTTLFGSDIFFNSSFSFSNFFK